MPGFDSLYIGACLIGGGALVAAVTAIILSHAKNILKWPVVVGAIAAWLLLFAVCPVGLAKIYDWNSSMFHVGEYALNGYHEKKYFSGTYKGEFVNNKRSGQGVFTWNDGRVFDGKWTNDVLVWNGTFTLPNGADYQGSLHNDKPNGQGTCTWPDGKTYTGSWKNGKRTGYGIFTWPSGHRYMGNFVNGWRQGQGTCFYSNGNIYTGDWEKDVRTGKGVEFYPSTGNRFTGSFKEDQFYTGVLRDGGGYKIEEWEKGELVWPKS